MTTEEKEKLVNFVYSMRNTTIEKEQDYILDVLKEIKEKIEKELKSTEVRKNDFDKKDIAILYGYELGKETELEITLSIIDSIKEAIIYGKNM